MELSKKQIIAIVVVAAVLASALFVIYDFNGKSLDLSGRSTRIVVTDSMDGDHHPDYCLKCDCGYVHFGEYYKNGSEVSVHCPNCNTLMTTKVPCSYDIVKIPVNSLIMVKSLSLSEKQGLDIGDVISFYSESNKLQTIHRITAKVYDGSGNLVGFNTRGDNTNGGDDTSIAFFDTIEGEVVGVSPVMGQFVHMIQGSSVIFLIMIVVILGVIVSVIRDMFKISKSERDAESKENDLEVQETESSDEEEQ